MTIDYTYYGYGVALPILGYLCGITLSLCLKALKLGEKI